MIATPQPLSLNHLHLCPRVYVSKFYLLVGLIPPSSMGLYVAVSDPAQYEWDLSVYFLFLAGRSGIYSVDASIDGLVSLIYFTPHAGIITILELRCSDICVLPCGFIS